MYSVMIVEDEYFVRVGIRMTLDWQSLGLEVTAEAANGEEALALYCEKRPDIIITDIKMAGMDGMELIRRIRETDQDTRIIILSNLEEFNLVRRAISLNVSDYILKLTMETSVIHDVLRRVKEEIALIEKSRILLSKPETEKDCARAVLEHLLYGMHATAELNARLLALPCPFTLDSVILAVMEIDNYEQVQEVFDDQYGNLIYTAFSNVISELMAERGRGLVIHRRNSRYILLMDMSTAQTPQQGETIFLACLAHVNQVLYSHFNSCITFGVSEVSTRPGQLLQLYAQAKQSLDLRFFCEIGTSLVWRKVMAQDLPALLGEKLGHSTRDEMPNGPAKKNMPALVHALQQNPSRENVLQMFLQLLHSETNHLALNRQNSLALIKSYEAQMQASLTLDEMIRVFLRFVSYMGGGKTQGTLPAERMSSTIIRALAFISENHSQNLTLEQIAHSVSLSKNYLCSLFKKEMGINLISYILVFRMEQAKDLLLNTSLKSYEIAERVGFSNESYFSRSFKKVVGKSPVDFRQSAVIPL